MSQCSAELGCIQILNALSLPFSQRGGETNTQAALELLYISVFTAAHGDRQSVPNISVVITDGRSNVLQDRTLSEAETARQQGIEMFVVGVGDDVHLAELNGIASTPASDHVIMIASTSDSGYAASDLLDKLCA